MSYTYNQDKINRLLKEQGIEPDTIDFASYSNDIPIEEWLLNEYGIKLESLREKVEYIKAVQEQQQHERAKEVQAELDKIEAEIKSQRIGRIAGADKFSIAKKYISTTVKSEEIHFCIFLGEGGIGKSFCTISTLQELQIDYAYLNSKVTALSLYKFLYENKDKIIMFDDIIGLCDNDISISILMSALWSATGKRIINYQTTAKIFKDLGLPSFFEFKGKIILLTNHLNLKNKYLLALKDRGFFHEFDFSYDEKVEIMRKIVKKKHNLLSMEQRQEVLNFIIENTSPATVGFSFRTLIKAYNLYAHNKDWKNLVKNTLKTDERALFVWRTMQENAWEDFVQNGYGSRRTYFRIKKELKRCQSAK